MTGVYKLYGRPGSGSGVCEAVLALSGLPHEIIDLDRWGNAAPPAELLAVNALGQIPALVMPDGRTMTEVRRHHTVSRRSCAGSPTCPSADRPAPRRISALDGLSGGQHLYDRIADLLSRALFDTICWRRRR